MALETGTYISDLNAANPLGGDPKSTADDHIRLVKSTIKATFPNISGAITPTHTEINYVDGVTSAIQTQIDTKGAIAGQTWTGPHVFPSTVTIGNVSATEIGYLDGVTSAIQAQFTNITGTLIPAKGAISGQAWTGPHDFTGATVTVAAPVDASSPVTKSYADGLAFSPALPAQSGNSGKFITTDGSTASWADVRRWGTVLAVASASASATIDFTNIDSTYDEYEIHFQNVISGGSNFWLRVSEDNGATYITGTAYDYTGITNQAQIRISDTFGSGGRGISGVVKINKPGTSNGFVTMSIRSTVGIALKDVAAEADLTAGQYCDAIRLMPDSGTLTSGTFQLIGLRKSV